MFVCFLLDAAWLIAEPSAWNFVMMLLAGGITIVEIRRPE